MTIYDRCRVMCQTEHELLLAHHFGNESEVKICRFKAYYMQRGILNLVLVLCMYNVSQNVQHCHCGN